MNCRWNVLLYVSSKKQDCTTWLLHNDKLKLKHKYMYSCPSLGDKELLGIEEIKNLIKHSFEMFSRARAVSAPAGTCQPPGKRSDF